MMFLPGARVRGFALAATVSMFGAGGRDTRLFSKVDIGTHLRISFHAVNGENPSGTGGVRRLTFTIRQGSSVLVQGVTEAGRDQRGMALNGLDFLYGNIKPKRPIRIIVGSAPITVSATATNFHDMSNTVTVTYIPVDHVGPKPTLRAKRMS